MNSSYAERCDILADRADDEAAALEQRAGQVADKFGAVFRREALAKRVEATTAAVRGQAAREGRMLIDTSDHRFMLDPKNRAMLAQAAREGRIQRIDGTYRQAIREAASQPYSEPSQEPYQPAVPAERDPRYAEADAVLARVRAGGY